ncbi:MAG: TIGR00282 family metallophosphoesterase [Firmicutes bacterium]|nr:TIGR00282 family metallophosphoesterase [Bacillota bacterium]
MRLLFFGDIFGAPGRTALQEHLGDWITRYHPDMVLANGENAAHGRGLTASIVQELYDAGIEGMTTGNHVWDNKEIFRFIDTDERLLRPANLPPEVPGTGLRFFQVNGEILAVINLMGRALMPPVDDPFRVADRLVEEARQRTETIFVDFHAETTSEKAALGWYLDGRVSAVVGTHTHVQTADARLLHHGTCFISDVGMCGPYDSCIGMRTDGVIQRFRTGLPVRFEVEEEGPVQLSAVFIETGEHPSIRALHEVYNDQ